jgi:hypothetical protein
VGQPQEQALSHLSRTRTASSYLSISLAALLTACAAEERPSDEEIRAVFPGSWIVPSDSPDRTEENGRALQTYRPDGTNLVQVFSDAGCTMIETEFQVRWEVLDGVLTTTTPDGTKILDDVLAVTPMSMTLRSHDDGQTYTRVKAQSCASVP